MTIALYNALSLIIEVLSILILVEVIGSWVLVANVRLPDALLRALGVISQITSVILNPIRRVIPNVGGMDLSPIIALLLLQVIQRALAQMLLR
jgi:YggT family protein